MNQMYEYTQIVNVRPEQISALLSENRDSHRTVVAKPYILDLRRREMDDVISVRINLSGTIREFQKFVSGPVPVRMIAEFDTRIDSVVVIVVEATADGDKSRVTTSAFAVTSSHIANFIEIIENLFISENLRSIYNAEALGFAPYLQTYSQVAQAS